MEGGGVRRQSRCKYEIDSSPARFKSQGMHGSPITLRRKSYFKAFGELYSDDASKVIVYIKFASCYNTIGPLAKFNLQLSMALGNISHPPLIGVICRDN